MGSKNQITTPTEQSSDGLALYRKYRPLTLRAVVGQRHVTDVLQTAIATNKVSHAYLLSGPRGVGKTSIARILAHEINGLNYTIGSSPLDIIEIDAASNNGVEDVRELRERIHSAPSSSPKKIYIIDEVHMLSKPAFNALLKTLEEPPSHVVFILATTDADKLPATIISRVQQFHFRSIGEQDLTKHLSTIAQKEMIKIEPAALATIASRAGGSLRDGISLLDQTRGLTGGDRIITTSKLRESLGLADESAVDKLLNSFILADVGSIVAQLDQMRASGNQPHILAEQLMVKSSQRMTEEPAFLTLLSELQTVSKSNYPRLQLLSCLARRAEKSTLVASSYAPQRSTVSGPTDAPKLPDQPKQLKPLQVAVVPTAIGNPSYTPGSVVQEHTARYAAGEGDASIDAAAASSLADFDWQLLVEHARKNFVAIYSVLNKSTFQLKGDTLVIYTGRAFHKKKLDDARYRTALVSSLRELTGRDVTIETIGTNAPPSDENAQKVAALMGGGEEVKFDEI